MTPTITLPASPHVPAYNLTCRHCDWQANNVPQVIAARVIVRHMETQHGARS